MSDYRVTQDATRILSPELYIDKHGDIYQMPSSRADLVRHLRFQRRLTTHLASVIVAIGRGREVSQ